MCAAAAQQNFVRRRYALSFWESGPGRWSLLTRKRFRCRIDASWLRRTTQHKQRRNKCIRPQSCRLTCSMRASRTKSSTSKIAFLTCTLQVPSFVCPGQTLTGGVDSFDCVKGGSLALLACSQGQHGNLIGQTLHRVHKQSGHQPMQDNHIAVHRSFHWGTGSLSYHAFFFCWQHHERYGLLLVSFVARHLLASVRTHVWP
jgi:hypothetical protein